MFSANNNVGWSREGAAKCDTALINTGSDYLWYIGGRHETLKHQSCGKPVEFSHLQNCNRPEMHGHKRKAESPLCQNTMDEHVLALSNATSNTYMKLESWKSIRNVLDKLTSSYTSSIPYTISAP